MSGCRGFDPSSLIHSDEIELAVEGHLQNFPPVSAVGRFRIANPSALLHLTIEVFRRSLVATSQFPPIAGGDSWSLWARSSKGDPQVDLNQLFASRTFSAGDSYELTSGIKYFRGEVAMNSDADAQQRGPWIVRATWEPAAGCCLTASQLQGVFSSCELKREGNEIFLESFGP